MQDEKGYTQAELKEIEGAKNSEKGRNWLAVGAIVMVFSTIFQALGLFSIGSIPLPVNIGMCVVVVIILIVQTVKYERLKKKYNL